MLEIRRGKALAMIVESATVTDSNGSVVELAKLHEDGTYGDSEASLKTSTARLPRSQQPGRLRAKLLILRRAVCVGGSRSMIGGRRISLLISPFCAHSEHA